MAWPGASLTSHPGASLVSHPSTSYAAWPADDEDSLRATLGADLLYWWEVPASDSPLITLNGSNVSQLNDRVASAHMVQATAGNQPAYHSSGAGPNSLPYIELQGTTRNMLATISIGAANRAGLYVVQSVPSAAADRVAFSLRSGGGATTAVAVWGASPLATHYFYSIAFTGGVQTSEVTAPLADTSYHLAVVRPLASGALAAVDEVSLAPAVTGTDTLGAMDTAQIGHATVARGNFRMALIVNNPTAAKHEAVLSYVRAREGLSL